MCVWSSIAFSPQPHQVYHSWQHLVTRCLETDVNGPAHTYTYPAVKFDLRTVTSQTQPSAYGLDTYLPHE